MALGSGGLRKGVSDTGGLETDTSILGAEKILDLVSNAQTLQIFLLIIYNFKILPGDKVCAGLLRQVVGLSLKSAHAQCPVL